MNRPTVGLAGWVVVGALTCAGGPARSAEPEPGKTRTAAEQYYDLADLVGEAAYPARGKPQTAPTPEKALARYKALTESPNNAIRQSAERGLKAYTTWQMWSEALAKEGFQQSDIQAVQSRWSGMLLRYGVSTMDTDPIEQGRPGGSAAENAERSRRKGEATRGLIGDFAGMMKDFRAKGRMDSVRLDRYFDYQEAIRQIWDGRLLALAPRFAGPESEKPLITIYRGYRRNGRDTSPNPTNVIHCFKVRNITPKTLTNCTLDVTVAADGVRTDHRVYFFPSLKPNVDQVLQLGVRPWTAGGPGDRAPSARVYYSFWSEQAREVKKALVATLSPADKGTGERFHGKIERLDADEAAKVPRPAAAATRKAQPRRNPGDAPRRKNFPAPPGP